MKSRSAPGGRRRTRPVGRTTSTTEEDGATTTGSRGGQRSGPETEGRRRRRQEWKVVRVSPSREQKSGADKPEDSKDSRRCCHFRRRAGSGRRPGREEGVRDIGALP